MKKRFLTKQSALLVLSIILLFSIIPQAFALDSHTDESTCIHLFIDESCQECSRTLAFIESLELQGVSVVVHNIQDDEKLELYELFKDTYSLTVAGFPVAFIGENYLIGLDTIEKHLEGVVDDCLIKGCPCPASKIKGLTPTLPKKDEYKGERKDIIELPFVGEVEIGQMPLVLMTALIAFIDGFNPCSLWVLTFLLGIVIYSGSRKRIFLVGITFLLITTTAYGAFMLGLLNVFTYIGYTLWIKLTVSLIALIFAVVNIKDYFWYKKGISFTISDKYKPKLFKKTRNIMDPNKSLGGMLLATAIMALGIVLVELPCTAGFPMIWTSIMATHEVTGMMFVGLFAMYLIIYLLIEIVVFVGVLTTLKASRFEEKHGRVLKLVGGLIMLALATALVFFSEAMNSLMGSLYVFGTAIAVSVIIIFVHRKVLPKYGISIGSEDLVGAQKKEDQADTKKKKMTTRKKGQN